MKKVFAVALAFGLALAIPGGISAKGPTAKIINTGGRLSLPLEVTAAEVVRQFNPWGHEFRDGARSAKKVDSPGRYPQPYEVQFYVKFSEKETRMKYVIYYRPSTANQRGYIYVPVRGEPWHWHNAETIITTTGWFQASREWDRLVKPLIEAAEAAQRR